MKDGTLEHLYRLLESEHTNLFKAINITILMFNYQGQVEGFVDALARDGNPLEGIYRKILKPQTLESVTRLISPKLYHTPRPEDFPIDSVTSVESSRYKRLEFLLDATNIWMGEESLVRELDRRILLEMGYNPSQWQYFWLETCQIEETKDIARGRQKFLENLDWTKLMEYITKWDSHIYRENLTLANLVDSYKAYRVSKINPNQIENLESELYSTGVNVGFGADKDNYAGVLLISPPLEKIQINNNGRLVLKDTSRIVTTPSMVLSDKGVENVANELVGSNLPPYLVSFVHEFNHFLLYVLQRHPTVVATGLFYIAAMTDSPEQRI